MNQETETFSKANLRLGFGLKCDLAKNNKCEEITAVKMLNTCDPVRKCKIIQGSSANVAFSLGLMLGFALKR